jgi:single-strand DNA-binding protein
MTIGRFSLAIDRQKKADGTQECDFINCVVFGKRADAMEQYLHKGDPVLVQGHIQTGSYTNKDGVKVYTTDVIVDEFEFCSSKSATGAAPQAGAPAPTPAANAEGFMNIPDGIDEELPFN